MANDYFAFKRFTVRQPRSAMRVGTDGVLLGAWCDSAPAGGRMLDVGTGTGVIALILAQRNPSARIDAVEIDEGSCLDAEGNFAASPWAGRLTLYRRPFADFAAGCTVRYDRIVSNPPYFVASLKSPDPARTAARHAEFLSYADLAAGAARLLVPSGRLSVILPAETACDFAASALNEGLYQVRALAVHTVPGGPVRRLCAEFSPRRQDLQEETLVIEAEDRRGYSARYKELTGDFYLKM